MDLIERRKEIANLLLSTDEPISGSMLADKFGISRQVIVQDIAVLKASGFVILSTHSGYVLQKSPFRERVFKVKHSTEQTEDELKFILSLGGSVADVFVWHKVYGKIEAKLNICNEEQVGQLIDGIRSGKSIELMNITGGYHYHTVRAESEEILDKIAAGLAEKNYIAPGI